MDSSREIAQNVNNPTAIWSSHPSSGIHLKETKIQLSQSVCSPRSLQHYSQQPRCENHSDVYQQISGQRKRYIYIQFSLTKEGPPAVCEDMNEPGGHYPKWNKQTNTNESTCKKSLKQSDFKKQRVERGFPGLAGGGHGKLLFNWCEVSVTRDE